MGVGFADIVNFTRQSRTLTTRELARHVDHFEERALEIITTHQGRIIKTIGDEILFVADTPEGAALIGLELTEQQHDEDFPELRVGMAWGMAARPARRRARTGRERRLPADLDRAPGTGAGRPRARRRISEDDRFPLRRLRRTSVRGYRRLEPWALRRSADHEPDARRDARPPGES